MRPATTLRSFNNQYIIPLIAFLVFILINFDTYAQCTVYNVAATGSTTICSGTTGPTITLDNSVTGVTYQLKRGTTNVGSALSGTTGTALSWTNNNTAGTYTVTANKSTTPTCSAIMNGSVVVTVTTLPSAPTVTGGSRCGTGTVSLTATSTVSGIFNLYSASTGGTPLLSSTTAATSYTFTTPSLSTTTTYYITFNNGTCESSPRKSVTATINTIPTITSVTGGTTCGTGTVPLQASSSAAGTFKLYAASTGGSALSTSPGSLTSHTFTSPSITATKTYYITVTVASCESTPRTAIVATVAPPQAFSVTGGGGLTSQNTSSTINLSGSQPSVNYQLKLNGVNSGSTVAGNSSPLSWTVSTVGTYSVVAQLGTCSVTMGSVNVTNGLVDDALEFAALKDLYQSTNGSNWNNKTNWPATWPASATSAEFATWIGVDVAEGDVTALRLAYNNLTGTIPASLGNLTQLVYVGLNSNNLSGGFPVASLYNAHALQYLYMDHNQLTGSLPAWSGTNHPYMQYFNLSFNQFSGTIPASYATYPILALLDLTGNQLTYFPPEFASMTWLHDLRLASNPFPPGPMPAWIGQMSGLNILVMYANNFTGALPAWLGNLDGLQYLSLSSNGFTGHIPPELNNCQAINTLDLGGNQLDDLTTDLSGLTQLGYLGLNNNLFHGPIPEWIGHLPSLYLLYMNGNQLTGFPSSFSNLSGLTYLCLQDNQFQGSLPDVSQMPNLSVVNVARNQFSGAVPASFSNPNLYLFDASYNQLSGEFPSISNWTTLVSMTITGNQFSGAFPSAAGLNGLTYLEATSNYFTSFPTSLLTLPSLGYVSFQGNQLTGIDNLDTEVSANHVSSPANLYVVFIDHNQLDFKTIGTLGSLGFPIFAFPQNTINDVKTRFIEDEVLRIPSRPLQSTTTINWYKKTGSSWADVTADNEDSTRNTFLRTASTLSDEGMYYWSMTDTQFPDAIIQSDTIAMYLERDNMVEDAVEFTVLKDFFQSLNGATWYRKANWPSTWPATATSADFANWEGIVVENGDIVGIYMGNNNLHGTIPASLTKLIRLKQFYADGNQLTGQFPTVLFSLPKLQNLNLSSNRFAGTVPSFNQANFNLQSLRLGANLFTGAFPDLGSQTNLGQLDLSYSNFNPGPLPASLSSLNYLTQLFLIDTKRKGNIPDFVGNNMSSLVIIYLDNNQLTGDIPGTLSNLQGLQTLSLAYNQLNGSIPNSFGALDHLSYLNLTHNEITRIPAEIGDMQSLSELIVSYNNLEGPLPNELANCTFLGHLDITGNKVTGLPDLSAQPMGALKLSHNQFSGPIPAWIASTTSIQILQLADNQFSGPLPSGLSSLNAMRELTLDHNQLTGKMPDISGWSNLYLLDVSYNQLSGDFPEIPTGIFVVDATNNAFTSIPSSAFKTTAPYYLQFENNRITTVRNLNTDLSNGSIPMTPQGGFIALRYNYLDFAMLSKVKQVPINHNDVPQKNINDLTALTVAIGDRVALPSRPLASTTHIVWNKKINNIWTDITSTSEDPSKQTFLLQQASTAVEGEYFWYMSDSVFPGITIQSEPILVSLNRSRLCASMYCDGLGGVGINTQITNGFTLSVNGKIRANGDIKVTPLSEWPDFVFNDTYKLPGLLEVERYILANGHLPGIPSAEEVTREGIELVTISSKLLQKVEELTLYLIELKKERDTILLASEQLDKDKDQLKRQLKHLTKQQTKTQGQLK